MDVNEKKGIGVNLKMGIQQKRLWFAVGKDIESTQEFENACHEIEAIGDENSEWREFLKAVEENFKRHGFERIPK